MISAALDLEVVQHDDGTAESMYDLDILRDDRVIGAVEVTALVDGDAQALWKLVNSDEQWTEPTIRGGWSVKLHPLTRGKRLLKELPRLLATLEALELDTVRHPRASRSEVEAFAAELGVLAAVQSSTNLPGSIYCTIDTRDRVGVWVEGVPTETSAWIAHVLDNPDQAHNLAKLNDSRATERHLFLWVPPFTTAPAAVVHLLMGDNPAPASPPDLPPQLTHLWLAGGWGTPNGCRWSPEEGWVTFSKLQPTG